MLRTTHVLGDGNRPGDQVDPPPYRWVHAGDDGLVVDHHHEAVRRLPLKEVGPHVPRLDVVPARKLLRQPLGQALPLVNLDRKHQPLAVQVRDLCGMALVLGSD